MKVNTLPLVQLSQLFGGVAGAVALFMSPLPVWAALLSVAVAVVAAGVWIEHRAEESAPKAVPVKAAPGKVLTSRPKTVLDDDYEGEAA